MHGARPAAAVSDADALQAALAAVLSDVEAECGPGLLALSGERHGEKATRDQRHEGAPLHRWFLPSAVSESGAIQDLGRPGRVHGGALLTGWAECSRALRGAWRLTCVAALLIS